MNTINKGLEKIPTEIEIISANSGDWYESCVGKRFKVQSESKKGGRGKYVLRLEKADRHLMNGYVYGWVDKNDCKPVEEIMYKLNSDSFGDYLTKVTNREDN